MKPILSFPCYEPAGHRVEFTESELLQHLLIIGSTGCGKTTLLTSAIQQLLAHPDQPGLLILDAKLDGLVAQVRADARAAGREEDVIVFGQGGDASFDLFGGLTSLENVEHLTRRLMLAVDGFHRDNAYWHQTTTGMVRAALTLLASTGKRNTFAEAITWMRQWFISQKTPSPVLQLLEKLRTQKRKHPLFEAAEDQVVMWQTLDPRTRSNLQSYLLNVLHPLASPAAASSFAAANRPRLSPALAAAGRICIVAVPALREPELAKLFFRLAKQEFFDAVQRRQEPPHRLCGMMADEFPLLVTEDDIEQLATVRSKKCCIIAGTQGLETIHKRLGVGGGRAAINNFNNVIFMRNRETETALMAFMTLGLRREKIRPAPESEWGDIKANRPERPQETEVPVCPIGMLGRLDQHQAFLAYANGDRTIQPVWFVPWFAGEHKNMVQFNPSSFEHTRALMARHGHHERAALPAVMTLLDGDKPEKSQERKQALEIATTFFRSKCVLVPNGLGSLPTAWLRALPGIIWSTRKPHWTPHLPYMINEVRYEQGMLLMRFAQELPPESKRLSSWDGLRIKLNKSLYPNVWRPLSRRHRLSLTGLQPDVPNVG